MKQPACADTFLWVYMNRFCFFGSFHQICFNALYGVFFLRITNLFLQNANYILCESRLFFGKK